MEESLRHPLYQSFVPLYDVLDTQEREFFLAVIERQTHRYTFCHTFEVLGWEVQVVIVTRFRTVADYEQAMAAIDPEHHLVNIAIEDHIDLAPVDYSGANIPTAFVGTVVGWNTPEAHTG